VLDCKDVWNGSKLKFFELCYSTTTTRVPCTNKWTENNDTLEWFEKVIGCFEANTKLLQLQQLQTRKLCVRKKNFRRYCVRVPFRSFMQSHSIGSENQLLPDRYLIGPRRSNKNSPWLYDLQFCSFFSLLGEGELCAGACVCVWECVSVCECVCVRGIWNDWKDVKWR